MEAAREEVDPATEAHRMEAPNPMRGAIETALAAPGPRRHMLLAALALRLAPAGHIRRVSVGFADGAEAAQAIQVALAALAGTAEGQEAGPAETALPRPDEAHVGNGASDTLQPLPRRKPGLPCVRPGASPRRP
jgi:hypothetical protein